ncbi:hypothetical protein SAHY_15747 [Salinisphaera hydrothermalis EPR70]
MVRPVVWRAYGRRPVPSGELSARSIFGHGVEGFEPIPKRIWLYWEQPEKPELVAALNADVSRKNPDHEIVSLDRTNAAAYIPEYSEWDGSLAPQHKADLLRLYLVSRYGGIWMDSSIYLGHSLQWLHDWSAQSRLDFVGFRNDNLESGPYPMIENWFFAASAGHAFVSRWLDYLKPLCDGDTDTLFSDLMSIPQCRAAASRVPNPRYRLAYLANQAALANSSGYQMGLLRARDEAFSFAEQYSRNTWELAMNWTVRPAPEQSPVLVKMTQRDRSIIMAYDEAGMTRSDSLIGSVLASYRGEFANA